MAGGSIDFVDRLVARPGAVSAVHHTLAPHFGHM